MATTVNGKPISAGEGGAAGGAPKVSSVPAEGNASSSPRQKHAAACGEVGETGEHGDLGSNAAE